jgi:hypothetical protein
MTTNQQQKNSLFRGALKGYMRRKDKRETTDYRYKTFLFLPPYTLLFFDFILSIVSSTGGAVPHDAA